MARPVMAPVMPSASTAHRASTSPMVGDAAAGDDRNTQGLGQTHGGFDIDAGQHAVTADVGVDHTFDAVVLELLRQVDDVVTGQLGPAIHRHLAVLGVQADDDVAGEGAAGVVQEAGVLDRRGADDDVGQAGVQVTLDGVQVTDAAAELHGDLVAHFARMALMAAPFFGLPAKAPFRSTRCRRRAP
jgi:hypothetical protein